MAAMICRRMAFSERPRNLRSFRCCLIQRKQQLDLPAGLCKPDANWRSNIASSAPQAIDGLPVGLNT